MRDQPVERSTTIQVQERFQRRVRFEIGTERSWRLMERLGMRRKAHFRQSHIVEDAWRDEYVYAVLADEWEAGT